MSSPNRINNITLIMKLPTINKKNETQAGVKSSEQNSKRGRKRTKKPKDSDVERKRQAKKLRKRAILLEYYGHNGHAWCISEETAHELRDIENTRECGPIEERFWKEKAFRARKIGMQPPQTAEWCKIMDVISVTAVFDLIEAGPGVAGDCWSIAIASGLLI